MWPWFCETPQRFTVGCCVTACPFTLTRQIAENRRYAFAGAGEAKFTVPPCV